MKKPFSRQLRTLTAASSILLVGACSSGGDGSPSPGGADPALVSQLRDVLADEGVTAVDGASVVSTELFTLGQALFFDKALSGNMDVSCATCHLPSFSGGDGRTLPGGSHGTGIGPARAGGDIVPRNSPTVLNSHLLTTAFWDSRVQFRQDGSLDVPGDDLPASMLDVFEPGLEILAAQAMFPPTSRAEMRGQAGENSIADLADNDRDGIWDALMQRLLSFPVYAQMFADAYPGTLLSELNFAHVGNAIAAFEAPAFSRIDSPFQLFLNGDDNALSNDELLGALEFYGPGDCARCHNGDTFGKNQQRNIGLPQLGPGRGDGPLGTDDFGREQVTGVLGDRYRFRTTPLLNVELTAPYGHAGQYATLQAFVEHYLDPTARLNSYVIGDHVSDPALVGSQVANQIEVLSNLNPELQAPNMFDADAIVTFLRTLTATRALDLSNIVPASVPSGLSIDS